MKRISLVSFQGLLLTQDTADALSILETRAMEHKWQVLVCGPPPGSKEGDPLSLVPAGREIWVKLGHKTQLDPQVALNALWGFAVPLGFTPLLRYPLMGESDMVFHFFGPWRALSDRLLSEGRGHLAWPSVCAAAQCDVGQWKGTREQERFCQAQLHRMGRNCGPVDGVFGPRTVATMETLGLAQSNLQKVVEHLANQVPMQQRPFSRKIGYISVPGQTLSLGATGGIRMIRTPQGATLTIEGPGRLIMDVGDTI